VKLRAGFLSAAASAITFCLLSSCAVTGVGVEGGVGYDGGYYEPSGYDYGGWGVGYRVGPSRCCDHRDDHHDHPVPHGNAGRAPAYHPAPAGRPAPSIPGRPRGH
jgi:hypothetical protein